MGYRGSPARQRCSVDRSVALAGDVVNPGVNTKPSPISLETYTMLLDEETLLSDSEIDSFLGRHETGVISLAREGECYAIPISYGYDSEHRRFYLRLVSNPESEKRKFLKSTPHTRLVVYEEDDPIYTSVVATGSLSQISRDELTVEHIKQYGQAKRPLFEIWGDSLPALNVRLYRLDPDELSGRRAEMRREGEPS